MRFLGRTRKSKRTNTSALEDDEQADLCEWLDSHGIAYFAVPNGGARHIATAVRLKRLGVKRGVPDIIVPTMRIAIELKRKSGGHLSEDQKVWLALLEMAGWKVCVAKGAGEAISFLHQCGLGLAVHP